LNRELLAISDDARHADKIENGPPSTRCVGARWPPDGEDWCYTPTRTGERVHTTTGCCKSSGAMALEELPGLAYRSTGRDVLIDLFGPGAATLALADGLRVRVTTHALSLRRRDHDQSIRRRPDARFAVRVGFRRGRRRDRVRSTGTFETRGAARAMCALIEHGGGRLIAVAFPMRPLSIDASTKTFRSRVPRTARRSGNASCTSASSA